MRKWLPVFFVAAASAFSLAVYPELPERMPVHWDLSGDPDRYGSRLEGALFMPCAMIALLAVFLWLPSRDPRAANIEKFRSSYDIMVTATMAFMSVLHVALLGSVLGWPVNVSTVALVGIGILLIVLGNLMPRARSNFIIGLRTPWTLSSDTVWTRSNRFAGYTMVVGGLLTIVSAFIASPWRFILLIVSLTASAILPIVYSYIIWSREQGGPTDK